MRTPGRIIHHPLVWGLASIILVAGASWQVWAAVSTGTTASVATGGGGTVAGGNFELSGAVGLPHAGRVSGSSIEVEGGIYFGSDAPTAADDDIALPTAHRLLGPYPNPFNPRTTVQFELARDTNVRIDIHDLRGRKVRSLLNEVRSRGANSVVWNGTDDRGESVASGTYHLRLIADGQIQTTKLALLK